MTTITAEEALKSKKNFEEFIADYDSPIITSTLANYSNIGGEVVVKICDLTQKIETLSSALADSIIQNLQKPPFIVWIVTSPKDELLEVVKTLNKFSVKGTKIFVFAKQIKDGSQPIGDLNEEEIAFYDALTKPQAVKDFYKNEDLINMTRELTDSLRRNKTIDWQKKESARANMRKTIKRLLKKYNYPPEEAQDAIQTVMTQCELWTDNLMII